MQILKLTPATEKDVIDQTVTVLKNGGLVVAPSDTVYGLLVDARNEQAVRKLIAFKNRPIGKSISVFVSGMKMLDEYVTSTPQQKNVLESLLPGPFTVVLPSKHNVSRIIESEKGTLGVRFITFEFITKLITAMGAPTTATSANLSGKAPHHSAQSLLHQLSDIKKDLIDLVIDAGQLPRNRPSTVIDLTTPTVKILRQGDIPWTTSNTYSSKTPAQTRKIAQFIVDKITERTKGKKPVVIILKGDLGAGKTMFVKGVAEKMGEHKIISPTFTIYYEYAIKNDPIYKTLYHFDLYNVEDPEEFKYLGVDSYLKPGNILLFEWGEKSGDLFKMFSEKTDLSFVEIVYKSEKEREIIVKQSI